MAGYHRCIFKFLINCQTISQRGYTFHNPTSSVQECQLPAPSPTLGTVFYFNHSDRCIMVSHVALFCISLMTNGVENLFLTLFPCIFFGEVSLQIFYPFFTGLFVFLLLSSETLFTNPGYQSLTRDVLGKYFLPVCDLSYFPDSVFQGAEILLFGEV